MNHAVENRAEISRIQKDLHQGRISYEEAKKQAAPILDEINRRSKELSKKYDQPAKVLSFASLMRT